MFSRFVNRTFYIFVIVTFPSTDECYVYQTFYKHFINVYGLPRKHNMSVLLDAYIGMYVRVHESETQAYCHDDKPYLQATHHTHTHTHIYTWNSIILSKLRSDIWLRFNLSTLKRKSNIYFIVAIVAAARTLFHSLAHAHTRTLYTYVETYLESRIHVLSFEE